MGETLIYKICAATEWAEAEALGAYLGSDDDARDGFIHLSTAAQAAGTLEKYFSDRTGLVLIAFAPDAFGQALRWEVSRGGARFPHVYGDLPVAAAQAVLALPDDPAARAALVAELAE